MSTAEAQRYLDIAAHDFRILTVLCSDDSGDDTTDWQVTLLYYVLCLHLKALAACESRDLQDHYATKEWINTRSDLAGIAKPYRKAEEWSREARYEGRTFDPREVERCVGWFRDVRRHVDALLQGFGLKSPAEIAPDRIPLGPP